MNVKLVTLFDDACYAIELLSAVKTKQGDCIAISHGIIDTELYD
jgi:hypothetical protein